jgi:uncharacterized protein YndB with AHSA1/START domain
MATPIDCAPESDRELVLARLIDAPVEAVWEAWTDPELVKRWFTPAPWTTVAAEMDIRAGGSSCVTMRSPEGQEFPNPGVFLEVVPMRRLVMTDAYVEAWRPSEKPFMTVDLTLEPVGGQTRYIARVRHWTAEDKAEHEKMGFHEGWGKATDQLEEVAREVAGRPTGPRAA